MGEVVRAIIPRWPDEPTSVALGFVLPGVNIDLTEVAETFLRQLPAKSVRMHHSGGVVSLVAAFGEEWMVRVLLKVDIQSDAEHMAKTGFLREHRQAAEIATCDRMVEVMFADPETTVAAFEALEAAREWLAEHANVIAVDPDTGESL